LNDELLRQAKEEAARRRETLTALIEAGLRRVLVESKSIRRRVRVTLPVSRSKGGVLPEVELNNTADLLDIMEGRR
jgi:hypothetical protein